MKNVKANANNSCRRGCKGAVIPHLILIAGTYVLSAGLIGTYAWKEVLTSSQFWGLILIFGAFCGFAAKRMQ